MQSEQSTTQRATSRNGSEPSTNQRLAYATDRAKVLFACYRRGDAHDPDAYVAAISAVLSLYDFDIIREATDPRTGISTNEKFRSFMPNSGELKAHCDALAERRHRLEQLAKIPRPVPASHRLEAPTDRPQGYVANIHVYEGHPRYAKLAEWTKTQAPKFFRFGPSDGIPGLWIPLNVWQDGGAQQVAKKFEMPKSFALTPEARAVMADRLNPSPSNEDAA